MNEDRAWPASAPQNGDGVGVMIEAGGGRPFTRAAVIPQNFELLDQLDQEIAAALQIQARASWRRIAAAVGSNEHTVRRRGKRLLDTGTIRTTVIMDPILVEVRGLLQFTCGSGHAISVGRALAERGDVRFVALVTGPFDVVAEILAPTSRDMARVILEELPAIPGINGATTETVLRTFKTSYDWSREILGVRASGLDQPPFSDVKVDPATLDVVDRRIVDRLRVDGRYSIADLAASCGVTESLARRRLEHLLTRSGVRPIALVDPHLLGYDVELLLWLRVDLACLEQVATALAARREVRYISATSGYRDLVCEVILRRQSDAYDFFTTVLATLPGIRQVDTASELVTLKRAYFQVA
ncbi:MAG TPA: Lrp/AsnC family transcriptional regulator [Chloroflexota bacterium]|nr:Lrp/AsnC family transcriptional regulator [Chloroflexota bacterium]